jgi:hypothetical protein
MQIGYPIFKVQDLTDKGILAKEIGVDRNIAYRVNA